MTRFESGDHQSLGGWIESRRRAMNLTRAELAEKVGCASVTIKKIERDERKPSQQMAELLAEHLAIPRVDREAFLHMARGIYENPAGWPERSLRVPPSLQQEHRNPYLSTVDFVERHTELARLDAFLRQALAGNAMPVFLLGDAGSGKTTLMREFARMASEAHPRLLVAGGQCSAQTGRGDPFRPFRDIFGILTGDLEIDWPIGMLNREQALQIWAAIPEVIQAVTQFGPHLFDILLPITPLIHRIAPYLGQHTDWFDQFQASADGATTRLLGPDQGQVVEEVTQVFRTLARQHPLLLILDDLQWADDASLKLLFHLGRRLTGSQVLIIGSYRTEKAVPGPQAAQPDADELYHPENLILEMTRQFGDIQIRLDQASPAEGRAFIDAILNLEPNRLGEDFREALYRHTRGHPLFTIEMLRRMRQNQNLMRDEAGYWVENKSLPPAPRPARVEAVIEQRLAHLDPLQRELLNVASVEGTSFTAEIVANVLGLDSATALKAFTHDLAQQHHLIQEQGQLDFRLHTLNRFQFYHMLFQEYLYSQLIPSEKRRLHRRVAEALEQILLESEDRRTSMHRDAADSEEIVRSKYGDAFSPALLYHFWSGEDWAKAATYAFDLGKRAARRYAMREAMAYYEQALLSLGHQSEPQNALIFDVLLAWEDAAFKFRPYQDQLKRLSQAEEIARKLGDKQRLIQVLHWTANVLLARGLWTQAGPALAESLSLAQELGNEALSVRPTYFKALMTTFADPSEALKWIALAKDLSIKHNDLQIEALAWATEGQVLAQLGEFTRSQQAIEHARPIANRLGSPLLEADVDLFAAQASLAMGNWEQALEFGQRSVERAIATDNMDCICSGMVCIGYTHLELGRIPEAASDFEKGIERSEISGAIMPKLMGQAGLAMTKFMGGHVAAIEDLEKIVETMRRYENHVGAASANLMLGACLNRLGALDRSSDYLNEAVHFFRQSQMSPSLAKALRSLAELMDRQGRPAEAQEYRAEAESFRSFAS